ncbi:MAG: winged helix-turn-helix domain-containing protein [Nanoarchaeota archaeon]|nr:winged helix-turn-helix domain-containing protein [Nanoarchaeota archaeon]
MTINKEINFLKKVYKREHDGKIKERLLILIHSFEGKSSRTVGNIIKCDQKLVLFWKKRYVAEGHEGLKTKQRSGKPTIFSRRQEEKIRNKISDDNPANPWTTKKVCDLIKKETGLKYAQRHVQRILHKWNFSLLVPRPTFWQRAKKVNNFFEKYRREIKVIWFPRGCPEMNPVEEYWRQAKKEVNGGRVHDSFEIMKKELKNF